MLHTTGALEVKVLTFNFVEGGTLVLVSAKQSNKSGGNRFDPEN